MGNVIILPVIYIERHTEDDDMSEPTEAELKAVSEGRGVIKNGRYFNTGKTYNADGTLRFDFDASNARNPWFNGDTFHGYDEDGVPIWNKAKAPS